MLRLICCFLFLCSVIGGKAQRAAEQLGRAIEYFQSMKYQEALPLFEQLDSAYSLSPRIQAYMGVCAYYLSDYLRAVQCFEKALPSLSVYAPEEQAVYYYLAADSHFYMQDYSKALPLYERTSRLCRPSDLPAIYYKMGFCMLFLKNWEQCNVFFKQALHYYKTEASYETARIRQLEIMLRGLHSKVNLAPLWWNDIAPLWIHYYGQTLIGNTFASQDKPLIRIERLPKNFHKTTPYLHENIISDDTVSQKRIEDIDMRILLDSNY